MTDQAARVVTLATGERVGVRESGDRTSYALVPSGRIGAAGAVRTVRLGERTYVYPVAAARYLGRQLDVSLFDVTTAAAHPAARVDVLVSHTGGRPRLPGLTVTADKDGVAEGYLTASSARQFGEALAAQWVRDQRSGSTGGGLFAGITRIAAADAPPVVTPSFPMKTLVIDAIGPDGKKADFASGLILNVDNAAKYVGFVSVQNGEARVSVPTGRYGGSFDYVAVDADGNLVARQVAVPTYRVSGADQHLVVDFRQATARPRVTTPRPVTGGQVTFTYARDAAGGTGGISSGLGATYPDTDFAVKPVGPVTVGTQAARTEYSLDGGTARAPYAYGLYFTDPAIPADQSRTVRAGQVGRVDESFGTYAPDPATLVGRAAIDPAVSFFFTSLYPVPAPGTRTSYLAAEGTSLWDDSLWGNLNADDFGPVDSVREVRPGTTSPQRWLTGPLAPGFPVNAEGSPFSTCWACRTGDALGLVLSPLTDATPDHSGSMFGSPDGTPVTHFRLTRGSAVLADDDDSIGAVVPGSGGSTPYTATLDVDRYWTGATTSTRSRTELTFGAATSAAAPGSWYCPAGDGCRVLPVLAAKLSYPAGLDATVKAGVVRFEVDAARVQGAPASAVTGATLALRPSGWGASDIPLTKVGKGRYAADVELPDYLVGTSWDVTYGATDAGGSSFTQTVSRAFVLGAGTTTGASTATATARAGAAFTRVQSRASCGTAKAGAFRCLSSWRPGAGAGRIAPRNPAAAALPEYGYGPADIRSAYELDTSKGAGQTVAIVDAYDNPNAEADLAVYRKAFGLPACTTANGCFRKVNQRGGSKPPAGDPGWGVEIALDIQAVSAACPKCKILLVEADSAYYEDIGAAVNRAVAMGADIVSNSYGGDEFGSARDLGRRFYTHPGVAQVVSSGDYGFTAASFPAAWPSAIAAGGTRLTKVKGVWKEKAWSGAGSGCSAWFAKPAWQKDPHCAMRTTSDVSAVADPETGFAVYDTYGLGPDNGWIVVGGTSLAAPLLAGMIGLAGNAAQLDSAKYIYQHRAGLQDVVGGINGFCGGDYLCRGKPGYDGPTGLGSPRGTSAL